MKDPALTALPANSALPLIVHVSRQFAPSRGGLEDVIYNLCRQLVTRGFRIRVVTCNQVFAEPGKVLPEREIMDGIEVVRIPWRGSTRYPVSPEVFRHLADADLVHVHAVDFFFDALSWLRLLHGRPLVATTHGGFFHTRNHALIKKIWFQTVTRISCMGYRQLACCSASDTALFRKIARKGIVTIENGADLSKFAGRASSNPQKRIVTIGRFSSNKRLENLIAAMAPLVRDDPDWQLDIVGVASDLTEDDLMRKIAEADVANHVSIHLGLPNDQVADLIGRASVFASASEYEGFGLVAIEAMSAGLYPVLQGNDAYLQLAAKHSVIEITDFTRPEQAAASLKTAFEKVEAGGSDLRDQLIREAMAYSWETVATRYLDAYERAVPGLTRRAATAVR